MARMGLDRAAVVREAADMADLIGLERLTMAGLAKRLGIALPSLYAHVRSLDDLRQQISATGNTELSQRLSEAIQGRARHEALSALASAYRGYALRFPGRYAASHIPLDPSDERHAAVLAQCVGTIYATLRGYGLAEPQATDAARMLRAALHGFVTLEQMSGFAAPHSINASFQGLVSALDRAFGSWPGEAAM